MVLRFVERLPNWGSLMVTLLVLQSAVCSKVTEKKLNFILPEPSRHHLGVVLKAFENLNIDEYAGNGVSWALMEKTDKWDVCWSWEYTDQTMLNKVVLDDNHRINHLPGSYSLVMKQTLYDRIVSLQKKFDKYSFNFVAQQFVLPQQEEEFKQTFTEALNKAVWDQKAATGLDELESLRTTKDMIAKCIEPLLISGHKFDIGFYVAITSIEPLRIYIYDNALFRFCEKKYPKVLNNDSPRESYVVVEYIPPWEIEDLKLYYKEVPSSTNEGSNHWEIFKEYLSKEKGIDGNKVEEDAYDVIRKLIIGNLHIFKKEFNTVSKGGKRSKHKNFFEMYRMDFLVDDKGKIWLMEVNQSPNMQPTYFKSGNDQKLKENIAFDLLSMATSTVNSQRESDVEVSDIYCKAHCSDRSRGNVIWNRLCWSCKSFFAKSSDATMLKDSVDEYSRRGSYRLLYPIPKSSSSKTESKFYEKYFESTFTEKDALLRSFFDSAESSLPSMNTPGSKPLTDRSIAFCFNRDHCSSHGDCVNGKCSCDKGYEGRTCYVPVAEDVSATKKVERDNLKRFNRPANLVSEENLEESSGNHFIFVFAAVVTVLVILTYMGFWKRINDQFQKHHRY